MLKIGFSLLNKRNKLIILILTRYAAESIRKNIVYIALNINTYKIKSLYTNISRI